MNWLFELHKTQRIAHAAGVRAFPMKTKTITRLGEALHPSPVSFSVGDDIFTPAEVQWPGGKVPEDLMLFEKAGPR
jgi:hypothetical protein